MATVGSSNPGVTPVLLPEHHGHGDREQSHDHRKRPTRAERVRRGRQRDKLRVQTLRDQLAAACSSPCDSSASEDQPQPGVTALLQQIEHLQLKLAFSVHRQAALTVACDAAYATCLKFSATPGFAHALGMAISTAIHHLASSDAYTLIRPSAPAPSGTKTCIGHTTSSPVAFDIFEADDSMWTAPAPVHLRAGAGESEPLPGKHLPQSATHQCDTAHADAAAGAGPGTPQQAPEVVHARHCGVSRVVGTSKEGYISHDLAEQCGSLHTCTSPVSVDAIAPTRYASKEDFNLRDLGEQCGPLPNHTSPERFDPIAHTCLTSKDDSSPQDLAEQCGSLATCTSSVLVDGIAPICNAFKEDFNSQDLAEQCGPLPYSTPHVMKDTVISPIHTTAPHPVESAPETRRTALSSWDEGAHPVESVPEKFALSSRDEVVHCSPVFEAPVSDDTFGPSARAVHREELQSKELPASQASAATQYGPLPAEFQQMFDHILGIFVQLREPSSSTIQATATAIVQCAKHYSVAFVGFSSLVHDKSEVLWRAVVELWHDLKV